MPNFKIKFIKYFCKDGEINENEIPLDYTVEGRTQQDVDAARAINPKSITRFGLNVSKTNEFILPNLIQFAFSERASGSSPSGHPAAPLGPSTYSTCPGHSP